MSDFIDKLSEINNTKDSTGDFDKQDIDNNKVMAILAYLSWFVLIPLFGAKESKFARFHCNQGIVLAIIETVAAVIFGILSIIPLIGWIFSVLKWLFYIACTALAILGIVNVANGKAKELPIIESIKILK